MTYRQVLGFKVLSVVFLLSIIGVVQLPSAVNAQNATNATIKGVAPQGFALKPLQNPTAKLTLFAKFDRAAFVQAGIGLRNVGSGHISVDVPANATILKAYLYWTHLAPRVTPTIQQIYLDGELIIGKLIGLDQDPCWGAGKISVNFADVTNTLLRRGGPVGNQYISIQSGDVTSRSPWDAALSLPLAESAHLLVVYREAGITTGNVFIYQPALTTPITFPAGSASLPVTFPPHGSRPAFVGYALADGQIFGSPQVTKSFVWAPSPGSPTTLAQGQIFGRDPSITSKASARGSLSDTQTFDVSGITPPNTASAQLRWDFGPLSGGDCLTTVYAVIQM